MCERFGFLVRYVLLRGACVCVVFFCFFCKRVQTLLPECHTSRTFYVLRVPAVSRTVEVGWTFEPQVILALSRHLSRYQTEKLPSDSSDPTCTSVQNSLDIAPRLDMLFTMGVMYLFLAITWGTAPIFDQNMAEKLKLEARCNAEQSIFQKFFLS